MEYITKDGKKFSNYNKALEHEESLNKEEYELRMRCIIDNSTVFRVELLNGDVCYLCLTLKDNNVAHEYRSWLCDLIFGKLYSYSQEAGKLTRNYKTVKVSMTDSDLLSKLATVMSNVKLEQGRCVSTKERDGVRYFFFVDSGVSLDGICCNESGGTSDNVDSEDSVYKDYINDVLNNFYKVFFCI